MMRMPIIEKPFALSLSKGCSSLPVEENSRASTSSARTEQGWSL